MERNSVWTPRAGGVIPYTGLDEFYPILLGTVREVFLLPLSYRQRVTGRGGGAYDGKLLRKGAAEGWAGYSRSRLRCVSRFSFHALLFSYSIIPQGWGSLSLYLGEVCRVFLSISLGIRPSLQEISECTNNWSIQLGYAEKIH